MGVCDTLLLLGFPWPKPSSFPAAEMGQAAGGCYRAGWGKCLVSIADICPVSTAAVSISSICQQQYASHPPRPG